jgi:hypothetical protein
MERRGKNRYCKNRGADKLKNESDKRMSLRKGSSDKSGKESTGERRKRKVYKSVESKETCERGRMRKRGNDFTSLKIY